MRLPDPSPVLDKNRAPMGPDILSSAGAGVWRKAPIAFPDSSSVLDTFHSETVICFFFFSVFGVLDRGSRGPCSNAMKISQGETLGCLFSCECLVTAVREENTSKAPRFPPVPSVWSMNIYVHALVTSVAKPFSPYSIQKRPEPQICPKFVPAIVFGGPVRGPKI